MFSHSHTTYQHKLNSQNKLRQAFGDNNCLTVSVFMVGSDEANASNGVMPDREPFDRNIQGQQIESIVADNTTCQGTNQQVSQGVAPFLLVRCFHYNSF